MKEFLVTIHKTYRIFAESVDEARTEAHVFNANCIEADTVDLEIEDLPKRRRIVHIGREYKILEEGGR